MFCCFKCRSHEGQQVFISHPFIKFIVIGSQLKIFLFKFMTMLHIICSTRTSKLDRPTFDPVDSCSHVTLLACYFILDSDQKWFFVKHHVNSIEKTFLIPIVQRRHVPLSTWSKVGPSCISLCIEYDFIPA